MMNDRFSAQLRQHLVDSADERPADGQVAAVIDRVAVTPQRHPVAARLTWLPGRATPIPSTALRYALIAAALVGATIAWAIVAGGTGPFRSTVFEGTWTTIDPLDGSTMILTVGAGPTPEVRYVDELATGGACDLDPVKRYTAAGTGAITGPRLDVTYPNGGGCGTTTVPTAGGYRYQAATDTLVDLDGVRWTRVSLVGDATPPPPPSPAFAGTWTTIDPGDGSAMFLTVTAGTSPGVRFVDELATGGACALDSVKVFTADGIGQITGSRMVVTYPDGGGCGLMTMEYGATYDYLAATDTLVDPDELSWARAGADVVPPTRAPAPERTPDPEPTVDANCQQFDAPGSFTAPAGSLSLTVTVPGTGADPWAGIRDGFWLQRQACPDWSGTGKIQAAEVTSVYTDACAGISVPVATAAEAVAAVSGAKGLDVAGWSDVTLGGYTGVIVDIDVPNVPNTCPDQQILVADGLHPFDLEVTYGLYLIDVEGRLLAIGLFGSADWDADLRAQVDAILASIEIAAAN